MMDLAVEQSVAGRAYSEIKRRILLKELKPGQRLAEISLAEQIGVSRTPVREALRRLSSEGWVSMVQNSGVWVSSPTRHEIVDAYEVRCKIELWGIEKAMPNVTPLLVRKLEESIEEEARIYNNNLSTEYPDVNTKFHMLIAEAGGNEALCEHLRTALSKTIIYMALYEQYFDFENNVSLSEHKGILEAIRKRDLADVMCRMQSHIEKGFKDLCLS